MVRAIVIPNEERANLGKAVPVKSGLDEASDLFSVGLRVVVAQLHELRVQVWGLVSEHGEHCVVGASFDATDELGHGSSIARVTARACPCHPSKGRDGRFEHG